MHFVVEPAKLHTEALECSDYELELVDQQKFTKEYVLDRDDVLIEQKVILPS